MPATVSVVIPFYNEKNTLVRCLDSVLTQEGVDLEIMLIDDGSTDGSAAICTDYAARDDRVRYIYQKNAGVSAARNIGLAAACGQYVQFVDADDRIPPGMTARLVAAIEDGEADMVACAVRNVVLVDGVETESHMRLPRLCGLMDAVEFVKTFTSSRSDWMHVINSACNKLFRLANIRRCALAFHAGMASWEDSLFNMEYLAVCGKVRVVDDAWYEYLENRGAGHTVLSNRYAPDLADSVIRVGEAFEKAFSERIPAGQLGPRLGVLADFLIIAVVSLCRRDAPFSRRELGAKLDRLCRLPSVRRWFGWYRPQPGQSRVIPFLVRWRLSGPLFVLARIKAEKRYKPYFSSMAERRSGWRRWFS